MKSMQMNKLDQENLLKVEFNPKYETYFGFYERLIPSFISSVAIGFLFFSPAIASNSTTAATQAFTTPGGAVDIQSLEDTSVPGIRENSQKAGDPASQTDENYEKSHSAGGQFVDTGGGGFEKTFYRAFPPPGGPSTFRIDTGSGEINNALQKDQASFQVQGAQGVISADEDFSATATALSNQAQRERDPAASADAALGAASAMSTSAANSMAGAAASQAMGAIVFTQHYLVNFTAQNGSWQSLRNNLFMPIAILLLLPGAVLAQVRAIVAQSSSILGEVNPFEGITRSIVAIFMIPATFLVVNYGIDLANALTYGINTEYTKLFGTDMYQDAQCAEMRAFPVNSGGQNTNAFIPSIASAASSSLSKMGSNSPWSSFEATGLAQKLFDPCVGLNQSLIPDEASSSMMNTNRMMMNGSNAFLAMTWNIMCAFQTVFLYYLWCMGPIVAALWVWPMERLRSALPSWIEGVITLCFWSLFWNVVVLLIACFRGVSETGTVIMTALNSLATISVWYAFDFSALISEGAGYSMMNAVSQAIGQASKGGGGGKDGGGGEKKQSAGGGSRQGAGGGGMGPGFMGGGTSMTNAALPGGGFGGGGGASVAARMPGNGMGGAALGGSGTPVTFDANAAGGSLPVGGGSTLMAGTPGLMPRGGGSVLPTISTASSGSKASSSSYNALNANELKDRQINQNNLNKKQLDQQNQASLMQAFAQDQERQKQEANKQGETKQVDARAMAMLDQREAEKKLQQANMANSLGISPAEKSQLDAHFNSRLHSDLDLPPQALKSLTSAGTGPGSLGGGTAPGNSILTASTGLPNMSGDLSRSSSADPVTLGQTGGIPSVGSLPDLPPITTFPAGTLSSAPVLTTSTSYTTVGGDNSPEIYSYTTTGGNSPITSQPTDAYTSSGTDYTTGTDYAYTASGTDPVYRTEQTVGWSNVDNLGRESVSGQASIVQAAQAQYMNQVSAEQQQQVQQQQAQQQQVQQQQQQVQYVPAEVKQERIEVQQVQQPAKQVQETIVQQQPKQPPQPAKPNVQKPVNTVMPIFGSPPSPPKSGNSISSVLAGMQKGGKPNANQSNNQNLSGGTLARDSNAQGENSATTGSLADHLSRLNRGGGRTAPKAKDILSELGLPPESEQEDEEEKKDS